MQGKADGNRWMQDFIIDDMQIFEYRYHLDKIRLTCNDGQIQNYESRTFIYSPLQVNDRGQAESPTCTYVPCLQL